MHTLDASCLGLFRFASIPPGGCNHGLTMTLSQLFQVRKLCTFVASLPNGNHKLASFAACCILLEFIRKSPVSYKALFSITVC